MLKDRKILLIITGGVAAYKSLELIRLLGKSGASVTTIMTKSAQEFITPLSASALSGNETYTDLFSLKDETEMGHIRLSRENDLVLIAPATANIMAKMAHGMADDLATTTLLATDKPVMIAPSMNPMMWNNPATQDNLKILQQRGAHILTPESGEMACGETGEGRMQEPETILQHIQQFLAKSTADKPLHGRRVTITSGPTYESIDPVRFIGNRSSGKQGHAIAQACYDAGANVTLITGPVALPDPKGVTTIHVETASDMLTAMQESLPADIAICAAAVCDWKVKTSADQKLKKQNSKSPPTLELTENPDILATISNKQADRPPLVVGFAAETEDVKEHAKAKLQNKKCDIILANDVSPAQNIFGGDENQIYCISYDDNKQITITDWPRMTKHAAAEKLVSVLTEELHKKR